MSDLALILFDVDGTLVNSQAHITAAMAQAFAAVGLPKPSEAAIMAGVGLSLPVLMRALCPEAPQAQIAALVEGYKDAFVATRGTQGAQSLSPLYPGIATCLSALAARDTWLLGIATGKSRRGLTHLVAQHGWQGRFVTLQCADDHPSKPHPSMVWAALSDTGVAPGRAVLIGDTTFDMEMARAAGVKTLAVAWGYHPVADLRAVGAMAVADTPADILPRLIDLLGENDG